MTGWQAPTAGAIRRAAAGHGLLLDDERTAAFARVAAGLAPAYDRAAALYAEHQAAPEQSAVWRPGDDPWNATEYEVTGPPAVGSGALDGLRIAVKSTIAVAGVPLAAGSPLLAGHVPTRSATVVRRALAAGAALTHTGRTDDLCLALSGTTGHAGPVRNPWMPSLYSTWGSSAGAAALVAADVVDAAVLVDQAGSGRAPAAGCGLVALMPTRGLIPTTGALGFTPVQDRIVLASRSTRTVATLAAELAGADGDDLLCGPWRNHSPRALFTCRPEEVYGMRVGVVTEALTREHCDPQVADAVYRRAEDLRKMGAHIQPVSIPGYADTAAIALLLTLHAGVPDMLTGNLGSTPALLGGDPALARQVAARRSARPHDLADTVQYAAAVAGTDTAPAGWWRALAHALIPAQRDAYAAALAGVDVLLTPTVPTTPPPLPAPDAGLEERLTTALSGITHTCHNFTGLPAIQIPAGYPGGLPVGVQLIADPGREHRLLAAAAAIEDQDGRPFPAAPCADRAGTRGGAA